MRILHRWPELMDRLRIVREAHFVDLNPIARWFYEENPKDVYTISEDFPHLTSPFNTCWLEYKYPPRINNEGVIEEVPLSGIRDPRIGILINQFEVPEEDDGHDYIQGRILERYMKEMCLVPVTIPPHVCREARLDGRPARWIWTAMTILSDKEAYAQVSATGMYLDGLGGMIGLPISISQLEGFPASSFLYCTMFALNLMHCKNVETIRAPEPSKKAKKRQRERGMQVRYSTIHIDGMSKRYRTHGRRGQGVALHLRRGHFRTYTEDAPLFGKWTGTWWWSPTLVGNKQHGVIKSEHVLEHGEQK